MNRYIYMYIKYIGYASSLLYMYDTSHRLYINFSSLAYRWNDKWNVVCILTKYVLSALEIGLSLDLMYSSSCKTFQQATFASNSPLLLFPLSLIHSSSLASYLSLYSHSILTDFLTEIPRFPTASISINSLAHRLASLLQPHSWEVSHLRLEKLLFPGRSFAPGKFRSLAGAYHRRYGATTRTKSTIMSINETLCMDLR